MSPAIDNAARLDEIYAKIARRIIPFLALVFVMNWLDRYNLGFAKLRMIQDLRFSETVYGLGAGILYVGYMLLEIPSNLLLQKIGARKTFARIAILWGIASIATMFVKTATEFYVVRFLLGSFEAGLFPGVVLYLSYWFPLRRGARMLSLFAISTPLSVVFGGPVSGWIMSSMGGRAGLASWQWLFLFEGIPSIAIGLAALMIVVDKPAEARWLSAKEKELVLADLDAARSLAGPREHGFGAALKLKRVWLLGIIYFSINSATATLPFWVPSIIQGLGAKRTVMIGLLSAVPYLAATIGMILVSRHSDRTMERRYHTALPCLVAAVGLLGIGVFAHQPLLAFASLVLAVAGPLSANPTFWQFPAMMLTGTAAAGGIALTNSSGAVSGWIGPAVVGRVADVTGSTATGLYLIAGLEVVGALLILLFMPRSAPSTSPRR